MAFTLNMPASIQNLSQLGLLERAFHDGLFPALLYRADALAEEWPANLGTEMFMSRPGLLSPATNPLTPGQDPGTQTVQYEQWVTRLQQFGSSIDTHIPTAVVANANLFLRNIHQLGLQAGQSLNRLPRNKLFQAYLSGNTATTQSQLTTDTTIHVASLNGFTDVVVPEPNVRPVAVSSANPLAITIWHSGSPVSASVVGFSPDNPNDLNGPGTLTLSGQIGSAVSARDAVISSAAPRIVRSGGGRTIDSLSTSSTLALQDIINAKAQMMRANVLPHADGFFHCHLSPVHEAQIYNDAQWKTLYTALPDSAPYAKEAGIAQMLGIRFYRNNESPEKVNSGATTSTGSNSSLYSADIGGETVNDSGVFVARAVLTGSASLYEKYLDESQFVTEAGVTGKVGEFDVVNMGISVMSERVRLVLRSPLDRLQQVVSASWSYTGDFPIPSDVTGFSGPERYKRAIIIESGFAG